MRCQSSERILCECITGGVKEMSRDEILKNKTLNSKEIAEERLILESWPVSLELGITSKCDIHPPCVMCMKSQAEFFKIDVTEVEMSQEIWGKISPYFRYAEHVNLHAAGEPLTHRNLFDIIESITREGGKVSFNSNGLGLNQEKIEKIVELGVWSISFSLDAATPETYEKIRGRGFNRVIRNIRNLKECKKRRKSDLPNISINMVMMKVNLHGMEEFVKLAKDLGASVLFQLLNRGPRYALKRGGFTFDYEAQHPEPERLREYLERAKRLACK
jgi:MoaA/NifB/PqqE/SkfB family radical SAM enzyme